MDMGHLYHDSYFSSLAIELAVKEKLKTREVNAREDRTLEQTSRSFDKAKSICQKNTTFERWKVGQSLQRIWERTPGLDNSLKVEKARVEALERNILGRRDYGQSLDAASKSSHVPSLSNGLEVSKPSGSYLVAGQGARRRKRKERNRNEKPLNTELHRNTQRQADFLKRSEHTVKALARLNCRKEKRQRDHEIFRRDLIEFSKPLIDKARVILKGRQDFDVEQFFQEFENFVTHSSGGLLAQTDRYAPSDSRGSLTVGSGHTADVLRLEDGNLDKLAEQRPDNLLSTDAASLSPQPAAEASGDDYGGEGDNVLVEVPTSPSTEDIAISLNELTTSDTSYVSSAVTTPSRRHFSDAKYRKTPCYKHAHPLPPIQAKKDHVCRRREPQPANARASRSCDDVTNDRLPVADDTSLPASATHVSLDRHQLSPPPIHPVGFAGRPPTVACVVWLPQVWKQRNRRRLLSEKNLAARLRRKRNSQRV